MKTNDHEFSKFEIYVIRPETQKIDFLSICEVTGGDKYIGNNRND